MFCYSRVDGIAFCSVRVRTFVRGLSFPVAVEYALFLRMADGGWRMADGGWRMAGGGRRKAEGRRRKAKSTNARVVAMRRQVSASTRDTDETDEIHERQGCGYAPTSIHINPKKENRLRRKGEKVDLTLTPELLIFKCRKGVVSV